MDYQSASLARRRASEKRRKASERRAYWRRSQETIVPAILVWVAALVLLVAYVLVILVEGGVL